MTQNAYNKPALTIEQQLNRLRSRGMLIGSRREARSFLTRVSYYRASAYWYLFRERRQGQLLERFKSGSQLRDVIALYDFDHQLRGVLARSLEQLEIAVRTRITYQLAHLGGGAFAHEVRSNFRQDFEYIEYMSGVIRDVKRSNSKFMLHYRDNYTKNPEHVPIWMLSETMSFGSLSKFYKGLQVDVQTAVCQDFGVERYKKFEEWLGVCSNLRNVCAHHDRLWNRQLKPTFKSEGVQYRGVKQERVFYAVLVCRYLLHRIGGDDSLYQSWMDCLERLPETNLVDFYSEMGCPPDWRRFWLEGEPLAPS